MYFSPGCTAPSSPRLLSAVLCPLHTRPVEHVADWPLAPRVQASHGGKASLRGLSSRPLFVGTH